MFIQLPDLKTPGIIFYSSSVLYGNGEKRRIAKAYIGKHGPFGLVDPNGHMVKWRPVGFLFR